MLKEERYFMIRVQNVKLYMDETEEKLKSKAARKLRLPEEDIIEIKISRKSLDARDKERIFFVYALDVKIKNEDAFLKKSRKFSKAEEIIYKLPRGKANLKNPPVVVGFGPCGMFTGLILSYLGLNPIIIEQGEDVFERTKTVEEFLNGGKFNEQSNTLFGEGGAGTFSDGKLTTRIKDKKALKVLEEFVEAGAPKEILYLSKPHLGTDKLSFIVKNIREKIKTLGGSVFFNKCLTDIIIENGAVKGIVINGEEKIDTENLILASGHSARDLYKLLYEKGVKMSPKAFAVGVRVEHKQEMVNAIQYGEEAPYAADYKLTSKTSDGRGVFSFCMCPGGEVVPAVSEKGYLCVNGMSSFARDKDTANSAILVQVFPEDFKGESPLSGIDFQRELEKKAFIKGGENYFAPIQLMKDFMAGRETKSLGEIIPTYKPGIKFCNLEDILPDFMVKSLKEAFCDFDKKMKGFMTDDAVITAIEARSSSPVRIERDKISGESLSVKGLYPAGEGAGYAGGIVSSAVDGINTAEKVFINNRA